MLAGKQVSLAPRTLPFALRTSPDAVARLHTAIGRLSRRLRASAAAEGLTPTETSVLFSVVRDGPRGMSELARGEDLNPTMLSRVVARLDDLGLVTREADLADRRATVVRSTPEGAALRTRVRRARAAALSRELDRLPADQQEALAAALPALEALVEGLQDRGA